MPVISQAVMPNGRRISLLKTLLTSACERNCYYCPFRAGRDFRRQTFKPDELAAVFNGLLQAGIAEGLFLSSGLVGGGSATQDRLIATAEILRTRFQYRGYLHLKLMPGIEMSQVERAMQLANRVSLNLEAPNSSRLEKLAPAKFFMDELLQPLRWVDEIRRQMPAHMGWHGRWPSMTTQFVVGGAGESDLELLETTLRLHRNLRLARAYFSAFKPVPGTPLENLPAEEPVRERRLYQASFLLRDYGFDLSELPFNTAGALPLSLDPKLAWAQQNLSEQPVEINQADKALLLRIPGIGPRGARSILAARRSQRISGVDDLRRLGINPARLAPYVLFNGKKPPAQLPLFV
jgi:predicted DNA-binding helix-hairpin-helix protein